MSKFKIGDKVRHVKAYTPELHGAEGIIVGHSDGWIADTHPWRVSFPGRPSMAPDACWQCAERVLEPLADAGADAFLERIRNLKPYEEPKVPSVTIQVEEIPMVTRGWLPFPR